MFYNIKNKNLKINKANMDYICFGKGKKNLIIIPGLGDGVKTVKGLALPYALMYKQFYHEYKVYVFSRRNNLCEGFTTEDMAKDIAGAMEALNIDKASILGISQGGMIAQWLAINNPQKINKLILAVTASRPNELINTTVSYWIKCAKDNNYKDIFVNSIEKSYSDEFMKKYKKYYRLISELSPSKENIRFIILANACLNHNTYNYLNKIKVPTLIIGADNDMVVGVEASKDIASKISDSQIYIYSNYGHAVYRECLDFNNKVLEFLSK